MNASPTESAPAPKGQPSTILSVVAAPWRFAERLARAVVIYPVRNLGKHMPMG